MKPYLQGNDRLEDFSPGQNGWTDGCRRSRAPRLAGDSAKEPGIRLAAISSSAEALLQMDLGIHRLLMEF